MQNIKAIRARIKAANNIRQITRAMKLVAAARLKKAQDRVLQSRPYSEKMRELMSHLTLSGESIDHPLLKVNGSSGKTGLLVIASERGLAGSYNVNIMRKTVDTVKPIGIEAFKIVSVNRKVQSFFFRRGYDIVSHFTLPNTGPTIQDALNITSQLQSMFVNGEVDKVEIVYSKFISALVQSPQVVQLLPIQPPTMEHVQEHEYVFEPSPKALLEQLLPRYLFTLVHQALLEATASEHAARMTAMSSATDNAGKIITDLTMTANRARQASITTEILEVVSGANAQNG